MQFNHMTQSDFPKVPEIVPPANEFEYERWSEYETRLTLCNCPWGTSEVQVGQRAIGGLGKVVKFADDSARDRWFDVLNGKLTFTTPYRGFSQESFQIGVPFDIALQFNYLYVEYNPATSADALIDYEGVNGVRRIYYFIRDIKYRSPNNTEIIVLLDYWTTFVNSLEFTALGVERGHVAVKQTTVQQYLANPIANSEYLLHDDVSGVSVGANAHGAIQMVFNDGVQYAIIASTANMQTTAANGREAVYCNYSDRTQTPTYYAAACNVSDLPDLMSALNTICPQFIATITGVYIVDGSLFTRGRAFTVGGVNVYPVGGGVMDTSRTYSFTKNDFGIDAKFSNLAKLYTYPYAMLEVTDWRGGVHHVRVEDCPGTLTLEVMSNITAPFMALQAALLGVGGGAAMDITFKNIETLTYRTQGREHDYTWAWDIPCYGVTQQPSIDYDIHSVHDRAQRAEENATNQTNALASNASNNANALDLNETAHTNQANNIARLKSNIEDQQELETKTKNRNNTLIDDETRINLAKLSDDSMADILCSMAIVGAENEATAVTAAHNQAMGIAGNVATGALAGATAGSVVPGAGTVAGAVAGGVGGAISGIVGAESIGFNSMVSITTNEDVAQATQDATRSKAQAAATHADASRDLRKAYNDATNALLQQKVSEISVRNRDTDNNANDLSKTTADAMANRTKATADANTNRAKATADNAITRAIAQAGLREPRVFGEWANGKDAAIKPMGLDFAIVTQNKADIALAGEAFLRYGYMVNRWFDFSTFNYGSKFTYWKCFDINTSQINIPDAFIDRIKALLLGGITVYSHPDYIASATLYNNGF